MAGFRFDAITVLFEDSELRDEKELKGKDGKSYLNNFGDLDITDEMSNNRPETYKVLQHVRQMEDGFDSKAFPGHRIMIGETYVPTIQDLRKLYGTTKKPEFELPMDISVAPKRYDSGSQPFC